MTQHNVMNNRHHNFTVFHRPDSYSTLTLPELHIVIHEDLIEIKGHGFTCSERPQFIDVIPLNHTHCLLQNGNWSVQVSMIHLDTITKHTGITSSFKE